MPVGSEVVWIPVIAAFVIPALLSEKVPLTPVT
jgi:hypothetical protein